MKRQGNPKEELENQNFITLSSCNFYLFRQGNPKRINLKRRAASYQFEMLLFFPLALYIRQGNPKGKIRQLELLKHSIKLILTFKKGPQEAQETQWISRWTRRKERSSCAGRLVLFDWSSLFILVTSCLTQGKPKGKQDGPKGRRHPHTPGG